ncbi:hypothetical protein PENTCL1PPCAC_935, partial [Pristionchus entomophagus]
MDTTNVIQLLYGIPGVLTYFLVIYAMRRVRRVLNKSFIIIYTITAAVNTAAWLNSWVTLRLRSEPFFFSYYEWAAANPLFRNTLLFLIPHFYYAQNACVLLLTFDRFAVIYSITRDTRWWNDLYVFIAVSLHILCLIVNLETRLPIDGVYNLNNESNGYIVVYDKTVNYNIVLATNVQLAFGVIIFLSCSLLNMLSLRQLIILRRKISIAKEFSFFLISFCIFIAQVLNLAIVVFYSFVFFFSDNDAPSRSNPYLLTDLMSFTSDLFSIGPAFYTVLLPGPIRRWVMQKIR